VVGVLLNAHAWVEVATPGSPPAGVEDSVRWINFGLWISLMAAGIMLAAETVRSALRVFRRNSPLTGPVGRVFPTDQ
jgi:hypothetical protein